MKIYVDNNEKRNIIFHKLCGILNCLKKNKLIAKKWFELKIKRKNFIKFHETLNTAGYIIYYPKNTILKKKWEKIQRND